MSLSRLIKAESYTKGTVLSVLFNIISKGILFLLTIIIARYFGSNIKTDIYFFVFTAMVLFAGFINNIDTAVLIPESMRLREQEGGGKAMGFLNFFLLVYVIIGALFTVGMYFFGATVFGWISKFSQEDIVTYKNYFWTGSLFFIFHVLTNYLNAVLTSLKYFSLPMVISSVKSCVVILCIFLLKADYDVLSVFIGGLISYAVNLLIQLYVLKQIAGWNFGMKRGIIKKGIWSNIFYAELGQVTTVASSMFPLYLLSGFGSGVISVMNYGKNIADIPNTLITSQFANVSGIKLNEQSASNDAAGMNETFLKLSKMMIFILVPVSCFMFVFAEPMILVFYKTEKFTAESVTESARFLQLLSVTIFSIAVNTMVARLFIATQLMRPAFIYQFMMNCFLIMAIWIFSKYFGAYGYPYGMILMNAVNFMAMFFVCKKYFRNIQYDRLLNYTALIMFIHIPVAVILFYTLQSASIYFLYKLLPGIFIYVILFVVMSKIKKTAIHETIFY